MAPERVARHQRARLEGAMIEAVARHGFSGTTLRELVTLAGVSKTTFYQHFESKQDCFLATFDEISAILAEAIGNAYAEQGPLRDKVVAALGALAELVVREPGAASLASVDLMTLGKAGIAHRERATDRFVGMIRHTLEEVPTERDVPAITVRAALTGVHAVVYRRLREGAVEELPNQVETIAEWALSYLNPDDEVERRAVAASERPREHHSSPTEVNGVPGWQEPPDSRLSRRTLSQRERIMRAAAGVAVEHGYEALSIPAISGAAGVSNQTFYEHFSGKRDAFLAAFDAVAAQALTVATEAFEAEDDPAAGVGAGIRALIDHIVINHQFARLAFYELPTAGPPALDRADAVLDSFVVPLRPELHPRGPEGAPPREIREAIATGIWSAIQHEIEHGRTVALPALAPQITRLAIPPPA